MGSVAVVAERPPTFEAMANNAIAQPPIAGGLGAAFTQWTLSRSPDAILLLGCVATPIPGWVDDMAPVVEARTVGLMQSSAERLLAIPVSAQLEARATGGHFSLRSAGVAADASPIGIARTFVGWNEGAVATCFAICAETERKGGLNHEIREHLAESERRCDASVLGARLEGSVGAPPAGLVLGAITWAIHHPSETVTGAGALAVALGLVAIGSRRRSRSRI